VISGDTLHRPTNTSIGIEGQEDIESLEKTLQIYAGRLPTDRMGVSQLLSKMIDRST
jgi:hypothetical protein